MKIFRIALTAVMLLSLHVTSFCMDQTDRPRKNSHDGTRIEFFGNGGGLWGSGTDTLDKLGQPYGNNHVYGPGSDPDAINRWSEVGKNKIKTVAHAQAYIQAMKAKGWTLPKDAMQPSLDLIKSIEFDDNQDLIEDYALTAEQSFCQFTHANRQVLQLLYTLDKSSAISCDKVDLLKNYAKQAIDLRNHHNEKFANQDIENKNIKRTDLIVQKPHNLTEKNIKLFIKNFMDKQPRI